MWSPAFACPSCGAALAVGDRHSRCDGCALMFETSGGILHLITAARAARAAPFLAQYRAIRRRDGHGAMTADDYRRLPEVSAAHPNALEWQVRRESWLTLRRLLRAPGAAAAQPPAAALRVLDAGAGNGWMCNRLVGEGHLAVAADLNVDPIDGLGACSVYGARFPRVHADFDALPFASAQFDLVVMNAALHYAADPVRTLAAAARLTTRDGTLVVMDSPIVADAAEGEAMVDRQYEQMSRRFGVAPVRIGLGYLTPGLLNEAAAATGRRGRFVRSRGPLSWQARQAWGWWRGGRRPARFGVWTAR